MTSYSKYIKLALESIIILYPRLPVKGLIYLDDCSEVYGVTVVADIMITHMIHCLRVTAHHHTVQKMPYQLVVTLTQKMALILLIHLDIGLMEALMLRFAELCHHICYIDFCCALRFLSHDT